MIILCNAGGLGGGGNLTPFIVIFFNLTLIESIPIGNFIGLISSLSRFIINYSQRHPKQPERLAIDYDIIELSMPILYLGTLFGVQIGTRLNEVQLATTFACVLFFVSYKTTTKAISMIREENAKKKMKYLSLNHKKIYNYTDKNEYKELLLPKSNRTSKQNSPIKDRESDSALQKVSHQVDQNLSSVQVQLFSDTPFQKQNQQQENRQMLEKKYQQVLKDQSQHFTLKRCLTFGLTLGFLMITSTLLNYCQLKIF